MTGLDITGRLVVLVATGIAVLLAVTALVAWRFVLPTVGIGAVAVGSGLVRTVALAGFLVLAALRLLMNALEATGDAIPAPRLGRTKVVTA